MKASEFLCPELVSTDTDDDNNDDDLTAAGSEYESRMHTTKATPTFSASLVEAVTAAALHDEVIPAAKRDISSAARSARAQNKWNGSNGTRTQMVMYSKKRAGGSFRGNTYFPPWKIRDLDPRLHAI